MKRTQKRFITKAITLILLLSISCSFLTSCGHLFRATHGEFEYEGKKYVIDYANSKSWAQAWFLEVPAMEKMDRAGIVSLYNGFSLHQFYTTGDSPKWFFTLNGLTGDERQTLLVYRQEDFEYPAHFFAEYSVFYIELYRTDHHDADYFSLPAEFGQMCSLVSLTKPDESITVPYSSAKSFGGSIIGTYSEIPYLKYRIMLHSYEDHLYISDDTEYLEPLTLYPLLPEVEAFVRSKVVLFATDAE